MASSCQQQQHHGERYIDNGSATVVQRRHALLEDRRIALIGIAFITAIGNASSWHKISQNAEDEMKDIVRELPNR